MSYAGYNATHLRAPQYDDYFGEDERGNEILIGDELLRVNGLFYRVADLTTSEVEILEEVGGEVFELSPEYLMGI